MCGGFEWYNSGMKKILILLLGVIVLAGLGGAGYVWLTYGNLHIPSKSDIPATPSAFTVPEGFVFEEFSGGVPNARTMVIAPRGVLIVAQPSQGIISALPDMDSDGKSDSVEVVLSGLDTPHGLAFRCVQIDTPDICDLYVAERNALSVYTYDGKTMSVSNKRHLLDLPTSSALTAHKTRSLMFLPSPRENELLISIGSTCNVCEEKDQRFASVLVYHIVSGKVGYYATGLRNAVYMSLHPVTGDVWATEMGRDGLGDELPPDEVNIVREGEFYGWPLFYGKNIPDMTFNPGTRPDFTTLPTPSLVDIPAHSAPLGIGFIPEEGWPEGYWFNAVVSYHGSWNRSTPTGYKVVRMSFDKAGEYQGAEDFITGWLTADGKTIGRPADVLVLSGGTLYVSDDQAGKIYKLSVSTQK